MKSKICTYLSLSAVALMLPSLVLAEQTEKEFAELMPRTGTVETFFGDFKLDHGFPAGDAPDRLYDLMDHSRAAQLYLWGLPLVGMQQWLDGYRANYPDFDFNKLVSATTFNARRGILTANETTDYFFGFSNTRDAAVVLEIPEGLFVGMIVDMWQQSPSDVGVFGPNAGKGGKHVIVGPNTPPETLPEPSDGQIVHRVISDKVFYVLRAIGTPEEVAELSGKLRLYSAGEEPRIQIIDGGDTFTAQYQPRGLAFWKTMQNAVDNEVVAERDRLFMYWLRTLGIEKGKPFQPSKRQTRILEDGAKVGELMAKSLVYNERLEGVLRQNNWRMILGGEWGDGIKNTQRMRDYDTFDPRARYTYEAVTTSPAMTVPIPGRAQAYIGKFETENGERLQGGNNYVINIAPDVPAELFWSVVIYDTDTRTLIDNRAGPAGGKATLSSKNKALRKNADGSITMLLGPDPAPKGWEANHVQTIPGRGWFPYMRAYGATAGFFDDTYPFPTVKKVKDFSSVIK